MRLFFTLAIMLFLCPYANAQYYQVSGQCMTGNIRIDNVGLVDGKSAYDGTGTVAAISGVQVSLYWMGTPDNVWVLAFSGQPYYYNNCNTAEPPNTGVAGCAWQVVSGTSCTGTPALKIIDAVSLPVTWLDFTAVEQDGNVLLNWQTGTEHNNNRFDVQRSSDGTDWKNIGTVAANAAPAGAKYRFTDQNARSGVYYYRLVQVDADGKQSFSKVVRVEMNKTRNWIITNNGNNRYRISVAGKAEIQLLDMGGKTLGSSVLAPGAGHSIDLSFYPSGTYLLLIKTGNKTYHEKLIKP